MKNALVLAALLVTQLVTSSAFAGDWHYGCQGKNAAGDTITFNRDQLVITSNEFAPEKQLKLTDDSISQYDSADNNLGLAKVMQFSHKWDTSVSTVTLTELKSKKTGAKHEEISCTGNRVRDFDHTTFTKLLEIKGDGLKTEKVLLKCYDYQMTACG